MLAYLLLYEVVRQTSNLYDQNQVKMSYIINEGHKKVLLKKHIKCLKENFRVFLTEKKNYLLYIQK